jgi:hypothetical protein
MAALYVICRLAFEAGMTAITYQTITRLLSGYAPLLSMLSYLDCKVAWKSTAVVPWPFDGDAEAQVAYLRIARLLLPSRQRSQAATLGATLRAHVPMAGLSRIQFLKALAAQLAGRIVPVGEEPEVRWSRSRLRSTVQHLALGALNDRLICAIAPRLQPTS